MLTNEPYCKVLPQTFLVQDFSTSNTFFTSHQNDHTDWPATVAMLVRESSAE